MPWPEATAVIQWIARALASFGGGTAVQQRFARLGNDFEPSASEELGGRVRPNIAAWTKVIGTCRIRLD